MNLRFFGSSFEFIMKRWKLFRVAIKYRALDRAVWSANDWSCSFKCNVTDHSESSEV